MRKKRILTIICAVLIFLTAADLIAGNLLVSFALKRPKKSREEIMPDPVTEQETQDIVSENKKKIGRQADEWVKEHGKTEVSITSEDGLLLSGDLLISDEASHRWVIAVHGYGYTGSRQAMVPYVLPYLERGYNALTPDMRAHGKSEGKYIGMGWLDRKDIVRWIGLLVERDPEAVIVLHGVSMGGAAVMMTAGEELPENVKAVIDDCGYSSVWQIFSDEAKYLFHIPEFPLLYTASFFSRLRAGYGFKEASALEQIQKTKQPVLFIHGSEDNFVHTEAVYELYEACPSGKELYVSEGAGHGDAYYMVPEEYVKTVFDFIALETADDNG
ncbi:MAG: alpha/beta hydrolase [Lachnospiraceae bacterium]|nr:alpha/beta hydrolase [Lachnospiraceae bacterium]